MQQITDLELYLLDMINEKYIDLDLDNSFISNNGEIFLKIKTDALPIQNIKVVKPKGTGCIYHSVKDVFEKGLFEICIFERSNYYIVCDNTGKPFDLRGMSKFKDEPIRVLNHHNIINEIMTTMENLKHPDFYKCREQLNDFKLIVQNWIKTQIRDTLFIDNVKGIFSADSIKDDTYFQRRTDNESDIYYIIHHWWINLLTSQVRWTDIDGGQGKVFVSIK